MTSYWVALTLADAVDRLWASTTIAVPQPWAKLGSLQSPQGSSCGLSLSPQQLH